MAIIEELSNLCRQVRMYVPFFKGMYRTSHPGVAFCEHVCVSNDAFETLKIISH